MNAGGTPPWRMILYADIDLDRVAEVRRSLPTFLHLRRDVYTVTE